MNKHVEMPQLLSLAIAGMTEAQATIARALWKTEPALRTLSLLLDGLHPKRHRPPHCPSCENTDVRWAYGASNPEGYCKACNRWFSSTAGTPFTHIRVTGYPKIYATLLTLWGPWTPLYATEVAGCSDTKQFAELRRRLQPLFDELPDDEPLVSGPAYRLGFTPAQQGLRCLRCGSELLVYGKRADWMNPILRCNDCQYNFQLHATNRKLLPLPAGLACPECESTALSRRFIKKDGRQVYYCRDCFRVFVESSKRPGIRFRQRVDKGKLNAR